jgi:hypothetical protein
MASAASACSEGSGWGLGLPTPFRDAGPARPRTGVRPIKHAAEYLP